MLKISLIGSVLIAITVVIHAAGTTAWVRYLGRKYTGKSIIGRRRATLVLVNTALIVFALHAIEIVIWAGAYQILMPVNELGSFEEAVYFSFVTFTTLGYGDITLSEGWRFTKRMLPAAADFHNSFGPAARLDFRVHSGQPLLILYLIRTSRG